MELNSYFTLNVSVVLGTVYLFLSPLRSLIKSISSRFQIYRDLPDSKKLRWEHSCKSLIHSIVVCVLILLGYCFNEDSFKDPIWNQHWISGITVAFATGYAIEDLFVVIVARKFGFAVHHLSIIVACCLILAGGFLWQVWILRGTVELPSIFLHIRSLFMIVGKRDTKLAFYNNMLFAITFFATRIAPMHLVYLLFYNYWGSEELVRTGYGQYSFLTMVPLDILNIYWFNTIASRLYKIFFSN